MTRRMRYPSPSAPNEHNWIPACDRPDGCVEVKPRQMKTSPNQSYTHDYSWECDRAGCYQADGPPPERKPEVKGRMMVQVVPGNPDDAWEHAESRWCNNHDETRFPPCVPLDEVEVVEAVSAGAAGPGPESDTELLVRFRKALYDMAEFLGTDLTVHGKDGSRLLSSSDVSADGERDYRFSGGRS